MIKIQIETNDAGMILSFTVKGHSGTERRGRDIVCAGVSALTQSALLGLHDYLHCNMDYSVARGKLFMRLLDSPSGQTEAILRSMLLGLQEIAKTNSQAVQITYGK